MSDATLYFDRNIGVRLPEAMRLLGLKNVIHHNTPRPAVGLKTIAKQKGLFADNEKDDSWLQFVGERGWIVFTQDRKFHNSGFENELSAIKQFNVGCFYIWGAQETTWQKMRGFARAFDNIMQAIATTPKPFIYDVLRNGKLKRIDIP